MIQSGQDRPWWKTNFFISEPVLFGTWDGVFTSCMINIFGVIIFLRSGWMVVCKFMQIRWKPCYVIKIVKIKLQELLWIICLLTFFGYLTTLCICCLRVCFQGNAGIGLSVLIIFLTMLVALVAILSGIGVCERCRMQTGGVYFLLSHILGSRMGASVGVLYCFGQVRI